MESEYKKIYSGNFITIQLLESRLKDKGITPIVKDESHLGLSAVGVSDYQGEIDLYVHEDETKRAEEIIQSTISEMKT